MKFTQTLQYIYTTSGNLHFIDLDIYNHFI